MENQAVNNATNSSAPQLAIGTDGFLNRLMVDPTAGILSVFVFIVDLAPIVAAAFEFSPFLLVILVIFCMPVVAFIIFLVFSYRFTRYSLGTIGARAWRSLLYTLGFTIISLLIGIIFCTIVHGFNLKVCIDSCSDYTVIDGAIAYLVFAQTYLAGAYIGTIIGAKKAKKNRIN